ncbi:DUF2269 family protein [Paenibacillus thermotolerans]|uniref:DUF2269 family protein n=1 Tax=Paenibacillus thermotolerans TaxID=3027807 RepID=UPI00236790E0|nr:MULTISPECIES: DUF2269 family protein [unclassified Paenibacillus]
MSIWLTLHLIGILISIGNIITAAFWKIRADLTNNPVEIHSAAKNVMLADYVFTLPGIVLIVISGGAMAAQAGLSVSGLNWLTFSLILFAITGIIWATILIPLQFKMIKCSAQSVKTGIISIEYRNASRSWAIFGIVATLLPIVILYLMVTKGF